MIFIVILIIAGVILGLYIPIEFFSITSFYVSVGILAAMDAIVGAIKATYMDEFDLAIFISGLFVNTILAVVLSWVGDRLGIPLYYTAVFVFGTRLFNNLALIRRQIIQRIRNRLGHGVPEPAARATEIAASMESAGVTEAAPPEETVSSAAQEHEMLTE